MIEEARRLLSNYQNSNSSQSDLCRDFLNFLERHKEFAFARENNEGHFTASAWLLNPAGNKALLMHHRKLDLWVQPGGHCDSCLDLPKVALKEAMEESGIDQIRLEESSIFDIDRHLIPPRGETPQHFHYDVRFLVRAQHENFKKNEESKALEWISYDAKYLIAEAEESIQRMHQKWMQRLPQLLK